MPGVAELSPVYLAAMVCAINGGAPANVAVAAGKLGAHTAFVGKVGRDMHGEFLRSVLQKENVDMAGQVLDEQYFTTLAFVVVNESGERTFSFARKPGADTKIQKEELDVDVLDNTNIFHVGSYHLHHMRSLVPYVDVMKISDEETEL